MEPSSLPTTGSEAWAQQFSAALRAQRDRTHEFLAAQHSRLEQAEVFVEQELQRLEEELGAQREEASRLRVERDAIAALLAQAESRLAEAEQGAVEAPDGGDHGAADEGLRQRYQSAMDELCSARNRNAELQQQLAKTRSTAAKLAQQSRQPGWLDWEAEKQRIVAALEADFDGDDKAQRQQRLKIEEVVRTTDKIIAAKDREIQELNERLEELSHNETVTSPGRASSDRTLNGDTVVREERENLKQLQEQWRDKVRQAEVDLALERAKVARQRAELEEQIRAAAAATPAAATADADRLAERSTGGRWLARLGLTDADREPSRHPS